MSFCHLQLVPFAASNDHSTDALCCVQELDVRGNNLSDNGAMIVGRSMRQMQTTTLSRLDLGYNEIEDDGAFTIANVRFFPVMSSYVEPVSVEGMIVPFSCQFEPVPSNTIV